MSKAKKRVGGSGTNRSNRQGEEETEKDSPEITERNLTQPTGGGGPGDGRTAAE